MTQQHIAQPQDSSAAILGELATGPIIAALLALLCGEFALLVADKVSNRSKVAESWVFSFGKWMPGATGTGPAGSIGPYSGKETIALTVWLVSWLVLHLGLRNRSIRVARSVKVFLIAIIIITLNFIDPIADVTFGFLKWF